MGSSIFFFPSDTHGAQAQALRHLYPAFHILVHQERAKLAQSNVSKDGRRWPTPAVTKALLASYEMTVHRFPTFLRCLEAAPADPTPAAKDGGAGGVNGGQRRVGDQDEVWTMSRVNLGTSGWRLADLEEKKE